MALFDNLFKGHFDENSSCGFNEKCKKAKEVISKVCAPMRSTYGEYIYQICVDMSQDDPYPGSVEDVLCGDPTMAYETWGYECKKLDKSKTSAEKKKIAGFDPYLLAAFAIIILIIFLVIFKK